MNSTWKNYNVFSKTDYPVTGLDLQSWTQIKAAIDDDSFFSANHSVGETKEFTYGTSAANAHTVKAEIVKIDTTKKYVDFVIKDFDEKVRINDYGYPDNPAYDTTNIYSRLNTIYNNEIPSDLKSSIKSVKKQYYIGNTTYEYTVNLWPLNYIDAGVVEDNGKYYSTDLQRIKHNQQTGNADEWWLGDCGIKYCSIKSDD